MHQNPVDLFLCQSFVSLLCLNQLMKSNARYIDVYVIKILFDANHPEKLCGVLVPVSDGEPQAFRDGPDLLSLLDLAARMALNKRVEEKSGKDMEYEG